MDGTPIRIRRSAVPGKRPTVDQLLSAELAYNTYDGELTARRDRPGIGTDIIRIGAGATVTNILYVTEDGNDANTGKKLGDAKATIRAALAEATAGTVIKVSAGSYLENNPLEIPNQVSIVGDSLREVTITPLNQGDLFYVSNGNYISDVSFAGAPNTGAIFAFNPNKPEYIDQSPYIQNCTNFIPNSTGLKIDGSSAIGPLKSMVLDSYTQYNQGGIGCSITNGGYAQLVSMFTICTDVAAFCGSGGGCDLTNSNSSFGNFGLVADGISPRKYTGTVVSPIEQNSFTFAVDVSTPTLNVVNALYSNTTGITTITVDQPHNFNVGMGVSIVGLAFTCSSGPGIVTYPSGKNGYIFDVKEVISPTSFSVNVGLSTLSHTYTSGGTVKTNVIRPYDGQVVYLDDLYFTVSKVRVSIGGTGYTQTPTVTIDSPTTDWGIAAQAVASVMNGTITEITLISSGRGYTTKPSITISPPNIGTNQAVADLDIEPTYYSVLSSTDISAGITTVTLNQVVPYSVGIGSTVPFFQQSRILASSHSFQYIGSGTNIAGALPSVGGVPIKENEIKSTQGGLVIYTSTDQTGNFNIGDGVTINQSSGTITGNFYSKSLFANVTPLILALGGD